MVNLFLKTDRIMRYHLKRLADSRNPFQISLIKMSINHLKRNPSYLINQQIFLQTRQRHSMILRLGIWMCLPQQRIIIIMMVRGLCSYHIERIKEKNRISIQVVLAHLKRCLSLSQQIRYGLQAKKGQGPLMSISLKLMFIKQNL